MIFLAEMMATGKNGDCGNNFFKGRQGVVAVMRGCIQRVASVDFVQSLSNFSGNRVLASFLACAPVKTAFTILNLVPARKCPTVEFF